MALYGAGRARRSLIDTISFRVLSQIATLLGYVVMVRSMPKEDFGVFNLLYAFIPVVSTVASLGLEQTLRRYEPEYLRAGNAPAAHWLVRFVGSTRFIANVVVLALVLLTWNYCAPLFKLTPYKADFALFSVLILLFFQARILQLSLASHMLHRYSVSSLAVLAAVKAVGYVFFAWQGLLTLQNAIIADTVAHAIVYGLLFLAYRRHCVPKEQVRYRPDSRERRRLLRYGVYNNFNDAGTLFLNTRSDNFFIATILDPLAVGIYSFYVRLNEMMANLLPLRLFDNVVQPMFFALPQQSAEERLPRYFSLLMNLTLMVQLPMLAFVTVYHAELVTLVFGTKYVDHSWLLPLIAGFATVNVIATPATLVAQYQEKAGIILASKVFAGYNVLALLALLPVAGLYGAAMASGSAQVLKNLFIWWHVRRQARWINFGAVMATIGLLWGGVVGLCFVLKSHLAMPGWADLLTGGVLCAIAALVYIRTPALSASDRTLLASLLHGREAVLLRRVGLLPRTPDSASRD